MFTFTKHRSGFFYRKKRGKILKWKHREFREKQKLAEHILSSL